MQLCVDVDNIGWIFTHDFKTTIGGSSDFSGIVDYFVDWNQWIVLCVRDARHWVRCISGQSDRRSVEEDTKEGEQQQQQQPNESASDDKWR